MESYDTGDQKKIYDVFVSYNPADSAWVQDWLVPRLKAAGLRVAIDVETFQPGAPVLDEIERCISESRKTIVVLTPDWVNDQSSIFESLLVQHEDPGARFRRLIPILLKPCAPPKRIRLLQWVDFTDPARQEQQLGRVVNAIQGSADLPELHPERAAPDATQRVWELRWLWAVGLIAVATLLLLGGYLWSLRPPDKMDSEKFGIAVAEFTVLDENRKRLRSDLGASWAKRIAGFIQAQQGELGAVISNIVEVWGEQRPIRPVETGTEAERAAEINAEVLIYGTIQKEGDLWKVSPKFFLTDEAVKQASELTGPYALGSEIEFVTDNVASEAGLNEAMRARTRALVQILRGLSHYALGSAEDYRQAAERFEEAAGDPAWGASSTRSGQEVLYLFLGNALGKQASLVRNDQDLRDQYLKDAEQAYLKALDYNPEYARVYNGLGSAYFGMAQSLDSNPDDCEEGGWDWTAVDRAEQAFSRALAMPESAKQPSGNVDLRAHLGLGRIGYYRGLCLSEENEPQAWAEAKQHHAWVVEAFSREPAEYLELLAAQAYLDLADMSYWEANWRGQDDPDDPRMADLLEDASTYYQNTITVLKTPLTEEEIAPAVVSEAGLLHIFCWKDETAQAEESLSVFLKANPNASDWKPGLTQIIQEECQNETQD